MNSCLFCDIAEGTAKSQPENVPFAGTDRVFVKPALGQFVDGYSLIVARDHVRAFNQMAEDELEAVGRFTKSICEALGQRYKKPVIVFEHGCGRRWDQKAGSCIDHAHLHVLPLNIELSDTLAERFAFTRIDSFRDLRRLTTAQGYLYLETQAGDHLVFDVDESLPSQFMRRLICERLNQADLWDWRVHPFRDRIVRFNNHIPELGRIRL